MPYNSKLLEICNALFLSTLNLTRRYLSTCSCIVRIAYVIPRHEDATEESLVPWWVLHRSVISLSIHGTQPVPFSSPSSPSLERLYPRWRYFPRIRLLNHHLPGGAVFSSPII